MPWYSGHAFYEHHTVVLLLYATHIPVLLPLICTVCQYNLWLRWDAHFWLYLLNDTTAPAGLKDTITKKDTVTKRQIFEIRRSQPCGGRGKP